MATAAQQSTYHDGEVTVRPVQRWQTWQSIDTARLVLLGGTAVLVAYSVAYLVGIKHSEVVIAFGLFIAFGELLRLALPGGREAAPIAMVGGLAHALLLDLKSNHIPTPHSPLEVIAVAAIGMAVGALPHVAAGRPLELTGMATRVGTPARGGFTFPP